ncbi:MAG: hypothetical protein OXG05_10655 [Gammaproteobacteria bacterium]|nr:hypothetical protein [Gammaproteobacteria bacterium]
MDWTDLGAHYLSSGLIQSQRALDAGGQLAEARGHVPERLTIKPTMANQLVWRSIYEYDDVFYIDAIRVGLAKEPMVCGTSATTEVLNVEKHLPWLKESQQLADVDHFSWFAQDYVAMDPTVPNRVIDVRYSIVPNQLVPQWGIDLDPTKQFTQHVNYVNLRRVEETQIDILGSFLRGEQCQRID